MTEKKKNENKCKQSAFVYHLEKTSETVRSWPQWRQDILRVTRNNKETDRETLKCGSG